MIVAEVILRAVLGAPIPERLPLVRMVPDRELGYRMVPNDEHYTYQQRVRLNSLGFRGPEVPPKRSDEYRIVAVGDSHVYGQGLADEELMTTHLATQLRESAPDCAVRVVNLGVRGYSASTELALVRRMSPILQPDHVVLFFYVNDFEPQSGEALFQYYRGMDSFMFDLNSPPSDDVVRQWRMLQILRHSAVIMAVHDALQAIGSRHDLTNQLLAGHRDEFIDQRIAAVRGILDQFLELAETSRFTLTLVSVPVAIQAVRDYPDNLYQPTLRSYAEDWGLDYLDLLPVLRGYHERTGRVPLIPYDGHYGPAIQPEFARAVAARLAASTAVCAGR